jgi:membrane protein implicated in regulation of membrane protease activity
VSWLFSQNYLVCPQVIAPASSAWRFLLGAWLALLVMFVSSALLALVLAMRHASTGSEKKYLKLAGGKQPSSPLNAVVSSI